MCRLSQGPTSSLLRALQPLSASCARQGGAPLARGPAVLVTTSARWLLSSLQETQLVTCSQELPSFPLPPDSPWLLEDCDWMFPAPHQHAKPEARPQTLRACPPRVRWIPTAQEAAPGSLRFANSILIKHLRFPPTSGHLISVFLLTRVWTFSGHLGVRISGCDSTLCTVTVLPSVHIPACYPKPQK